MREKYGKEWVKKHETYSSSMKGYMFLPSLLFLASQLGKCLTTKLRKEGIQS